MLGASQEFYLVRLLARNFGRFVGEPQIADAVWNRPRQEKNLIERVVCNLRRRLRESELDGLSVENQSGCHYRLARPDPAKQ